jgi:hypothetical protein
MTHVWFGVLAIIVALLIGGCGSTGLPRKGWSHYELGTVHVYSGASKRQTEALLTDFAKFRVVAGMLSAAHTVEPRLRSDIFLFPDQLSYEKNAGLRNTSGWFRNDLLGFVMAMNVSHGREILFHEYTHLILANVEDLTFPSWYDEGLAELMSTVRFLEGHVEIGRIPSTRTNAVASFSRWIPLHELFSGDPFRVRDDRDRLHRAYAQAWLVTHYFQLGGRSNSGDLERYLALVHAGVDEVVAARQAWRIPLSELEAELRNYVRGELSTVRIPETQFDFSGIGFSSNSMTVSASAEQLARLCRRMGNSKRATQLTKHAKATRRLTD